MQPRPVLAAWVPLVLLVAACDSSERGAVLAADGVFADLTYEQGLERACAEGRTLLLDFSAEWCAPCKRMDETTWRDPRVVDWVGRECVAVELELDEEPERAARLGVRHVPTVVFLDGEGSELGRLDGYVDAEAFLSRATAFGPGAEPLARVAPVFEGDHEDPMLRGGHGDALMRAGFLEEALAEYLWCWDEGVEHSPSYVGVRASFLLGDLRDLADVLPAAREAMQQRRAALRERLFDPDTERGDASRAALDLCALDRSFFRDGARSVADYEALAARGDELESARRAMAMVIQDELIEARRYDLVMASNPEAPQSFERLVDRLERRQVRRPLRATELTGLVGTGTLWLEACAGAGRIDDAQVIADGVLRFERTPETWAALIGACERAEAEVVGRALVARARDEVGAEEFGPIEAASAWLD